MPLKIALVSPYDFAHRGGVREHIRCLDRHLRSRGHDTRILAPSSDGDDGLESNIIRVSGTVVPVPISGSVARITISPGTYRRVKRILKEERFDVVHVHEPLTPLLPLAVLRHSRAVNVGTFHAYRESSAGYQIGKPVLEPFFDRLDCRIAVSAAARDMVSRYFEGEYTIVPNGIEMSRFSAPNIQPIERYADGRPTVLFVGRLEERKGFGYLLQAFRRIRAEMEDARLLVVGDFDKDDKAKHVRYALKHHIRGVQFIGYVPGADIPRYYRTASVFCAPSTGFESFGIVLLEAMAAGTPIVASDIEGYRSVLTDGREGVVVPPGDVDALARSIVALLRDPSRAAQMGELGRATAVAYDWGKIADNLLEVYQRLVDERQRVAGARDREERTHRELVRRVSSWFDPR